MKKLNKTIKKPPKKLKQKQKQKKLYFTHSVLLH